LHGISRRWRQSKIAVARRLHHPASILTMSEDEMPQIALAHKPAQHCGCPSVPGVSEECTANDGGRSILIACSVRQSSEASSCARPSEAGIDGVEFVVDTRIEAARSVRNPPGRRQEVGWWTLEHGAYLRLAGGCDREDPRIRACGEPSTMPTRRRACRRAAQSRARSPCRQFVLL